ncbi:MAG: RidA family protein [Bacteroidetes bacterium]|nr:RidA family protein [Bacteroidota bacterium]MCL5737597.1 RidA family protein [Bacteroidota bacterium]
MKILKTSQAPQPIGPYSQGIEISGFIFLSGQIGLKPDTGEMVEGLVQQTHQVLKNVSALLESEGCSLSNVIKSTVYLRNMNDFAQFNQTYSEYFKDNPPARTAVEVSALPRNALIEIDVIASK